MSQGEVTLERTTIQSNSAQGGTDALGGGILNSYGELFLRNATISGNTAQGTTNGLGGGMSNLNGDIDADSSTIASNTASTQGDSLHNLGYDGATAHVVQATFRNSILSDGIGGGADLSSDSPGTVAGGGENLATSSVDVSQFDIVETLAEGRHGRRSSAPRSKPIRASAPCQANPFVPTRAVGLHSTVPPMAITLGEPGLQRRLDTDLATDQRAGYPSAGRGPTTSAPSSSQVHPVEPRTLTLTYRNKAEKFNANLESETPACVDGMTVRVFRKVKGDDKLVGAGQTDATGKYKLANKAKKGKYYASVEVDSVPGVAACTADKSNVVKVK